MKYLLTLILVFAFTAEAEDPDDVVKRCNEKLIQQIKAQFSKKFKNLEELFSTSEVIDENTVLVNSWLSSDKFNIRVASKIDTNTCETKARPILTSVEPK